MSFFQNTCKPKGFGGRLMCSSMNLGHKKVSLWGLQFLNVDRNDRCLDIGCGGGANVKRLLQLANYGHVTGIDYSDISVKKSIRKNSKAIDLMKCDILLGDVMNLPFDNDTFNIVTAFETIYFWPDLKKSFKNVFSVLKDGGTFMICNESDGLTNKDDKWVKKIKGMKIFKIEELKQLLSSVGFKNIIVYNNEKKHWLTIISTK